MQGLLLVELVVEAMKYLLLNLVQSVVMTLVVYLTAVFFQCHVFILLLSAVM